VMELILTGTVLPRVPLPDPLIKHESCPGARPVSERVSQHFILVGKWLHFGQQ